MFKFLKLVIKAIFRYTFLILHRRWLFMSEKAKTKKKFQVPHSFVIVVTIIVSAGLLTWIV